MATQTPLTVVETSSAPNSSDCSVVRLQDIVKGNKDSRGHVILDVLWVAPEFRIYRTRLGVLPHFSDDRAVAASQRAEFFKLFPELSQANELLASSFTNNDFFRREVARGVVMALDPVTDTDAAKASLQAALDKAICYRCAGARVFYGLLCAGLTLMAFGMLFLIDNVVAHLNLDWVVADQLSRGTWAMAAGCAGALFATVTRLPQLDIACDGPLFSVYLNAICRMMIGGIAGGLIFLLLETNLLQDLVQNGMGGGTDAVTVAPKFLVLLFWAFVAGFSERFIPDLLNRAGRTKEANAA